MSTSPKAVGPFAWVSWIVMLMVGAGVGLQWLGDHVKLSAPWWAWGLVVGLALHSWRVEDNRRAWERAYLFQLKRKGADMDVP